MDRVAVIGGGIVGVSAAYHLARRGIEVTLIERDKVGAPNPVSSSGDFSKVFRVSYDSELYGRAAVEAREEYDRMQVESGNTFLVDCGMLVLGNKKIAEPWAQWTQKGSNVLDTLGWPHKLIDAPELKSIYPFLHLNGNYDHALLDELAGYFLARRAVRTIGNLAKKHGAKILQHTQVTGVRENNGSIDALLTNKGEIQAQNYICAAGGWAAKLFPQLEPYFRVTRQQTAYFTADKRENFLPGKFPILVSLKEGFYVFPVHYSGRFKVSNHNPDEVVNPESFTHEGDPEFVGRCREFLREYVPELASARLVESKACLYTNSFNNQDFLVDRAPWARNLVIASACSGHGFKHGSLTGRIAAELASDKIPSFYEKEFTFDHHDKARPQG